MNLIIESLLTLEYKNNTHTCPYYYFSEDTLSKLGSGKRITERKVYLFDGLIVLCKSIAKKQTVSTGASNYDFRLKEKFFMRRVEIIDRTDTEDLKYAFEISPRVEPAVILIGNSNHYKLRTKLL